MTRRIALHGQIGAGKTTLAKALQDGHRYMWINYTDFLKEMVSNALSTFGDVYVTVEEMNANKERWRPLINAYGDAIDFAHRAEFIDESLEAWFEVRRTFWPQCPAVFDNVRSPFQAERLREHGFTIVKLQADRATLQARRPATEESRNHPIEQPLPPEYVDFYLDASLPVDSLVREVLAL